MAIFFKKVEMVITGENCNGHWPEGSHRNVEAIGQRNSPREEGISDNDGGRRVEVGEQSMDRRFQDGVN